MKQTAKFLCIVLPFVLSTDMFISSNRNDAVSIDTRSIGGVKTGFYCAKVKSLTGLSTMMISIGVDNR